MAISGSQTFFENLWYRSKPWWLWLFLPIQLLLWLLVFIRRKCYSLGLIKSQKLNVPVVVIGNINVGGTGKTPLAIYLLESLQYQGYKPGLVTRGYGGTANDFPLVVTGEYEASVTGDEPYLIYQRTQATVVVDPVRSRGGQKLIELGCDIIICDDGLQHYALQRDLELVVVDKTRQFGNGWLMPLGPLREPKSRLKSVDMIVINGDTMQLEAQAIKPLGHDGSFNDKNINAVAAIGNPQRFFDTLKKQGFGLVPRVFPDHHQYQLSDFEGLNAPIVMTEKDAVKCQAFADERMYYLPVTARLKPELEQQLQQQLAVLLQNGKIAKNSFKQK